MPTVRSSECMSHGWLRGQDIVRRQEKRQFGTYDGPMTIELVPSPEELPDVLPTERLLVNGMAIPELRKNYRHIENWRNVRAVTFVWLWTAALAYVGVRFSPWAAVAVFIVMGPMHARFAILMHESAHKLLFTNK